MSILLMLMLMLMLTLVTFSLFTVPRPAAAATNCPCNVLGNGTPVTADSGPDQPVKLAMHFASDIDGYVTGVRFYKSAANNGAHIGELWEWNPTNPYRMASVTFTNETTSGWQMAKFDTPTKIFAGRHYYIAYETSVGHYAADSHGLDTLPTNGPLHALSPGSGYTTTLGDTDGSLGTFQNMNYWVDLDFTPYVNYDSLSGMSKATPALPLFDPNDNGTFGTRFFTDTNTKVVGVRYWGNNPWFVKVPVQIWRSDGTMLATATYGDRDSPSGWIETYFTTPVDISAGQEYVASYRAQGRLGKEPGYFAAPRTRGNYHTPSNAGVAIQNEALEFPTNQTADSWSVEPIFALEASNTVTASIPPSFSFTVAANTVVCNGEVGFAAAAGSPAQVALGTVSPGIAKSGGQLLNVVGNSGGGFSVFVRGTQPSNNLRSGSNQWADVAGSYSSPAPLGSGERFGYTFKDSTASSAVTNPASTQFVSLDGTNRAVMGSATSAVGSACIGFTAQASGTTPAGTYVANVVYSAVPNF